VKVRVRNPLRGTSIAPFDDPRIIAEPGNESVQSATGNKFQSTLPSQEKRPEMTLLADLAMVRR